MCSTRGIATCQQVTPAGDPALEAHDVHSLGSEVETVATAMGRENAGPEHPFPESRHLRLNGSGRVRRKLVTPDLLEDPPHGHDAPSLQRQEGQYGGLPRAEGATQPRSNPHLEGT
jgi:hypothetical protein